MVNLKYFLSIRDLMEMFIFYDQQYEMEKKFHSNEKEFVNGTKARKIYLSYNMKYLEYRYNALYTFVLKTFIPLNSLKKSENGLKLYNLLSDKSANQENISINMSLYALSKKFVNSDEINHYAYLFAKSYIELPFEIAHMFFDNELLSGWSREKNEYIYDNSKKDSAEENKEDINIYLEWKLH